MSGSLFTAWRPDEAARTQLAALLAAIQVARPARGPQVKPRRPDQWHITLCFIGDQVMHLVTPELLGAFAEVGTVIPAHDFTIERLAYWPRSGAVVALPHTCPTLLALCDATDKALRVLDIRSQEVTRQPHITLAYLPRHLPAQSWLDGVDCAGDRLRVGSFELLCSPGGRYESLGHWPLTAADATPPVQQASLF
ncbi:MAG TPA: 2'-5' RNA ligase family protein [Xanthomonadaceae bacterium]|nr:2'-5' RNA ligase family protein [Xanthomonadaceae bacterium]